MYPEYMVAPMREELTSVGFEQLTTPEQVDSAISAEGTVLVMVNSVCGCAAANARPGVKMSIEGDKKPSKLVTVFAGMEKDAVDKARAHMLPYPPSSPAIALFKDGKLVHMIERRHIEGRPAQLIAENLKAAYAEFC
jgi:putative YphP/YqiW family bacilliredoxin